MVNAITSRSISISWSAIDISESNGPIIGYMVEFQQVDGGAARNRMVLSRNFTVNDLTPYTNYTFRVAGVNSAGIGLYTDTITLLTPQDGVLQAL